jgi:hypothetical protein
MPILPPFQTCEIFGPKAFSKRWVVMEKKQTASLAQLTLNIRLSRIAMIGMRVSSEEAAASRIARESRIIS